MQLINQIEECSSIREQSLDVIRWKEVELFLQFERSYTAGNHCFADPETLILVYLEKEQTGAFDVDLSKKYGTTISSIASAKEAVARANSIFSGELQEYPSSYERVIEIYNHFRLLPDFLAYHIELRSRLGESLLKNHEMELIFQYVSTGKSITDFIEEYKISGIKKTNSYSFNESLYKLIIEGAWNRRNFDKLIQMKVFQSFICYETDANGNAALDKIHHSIMKALASNNKTNTDKRKIHFLYGVRNFLQMSVFADYFLSKDTQDFEKFRLFASDIQNPYTIDLPKYYKYYFNQKQIPDGLKISLRAVIESKELANLKFLVSKIPYSLATLTGTFSYGYRFIENILLSGNNNHSHSMEYLMTNRRQELQKMFELMVVDFARYKKRILT